MKVIIFVSIVLFLNSCGGSSGSSKVEDSSYKLHKDISTTTFWVGEKGSDENKNIPNIASAWDDMWLLNFGGVDDPDNRNGFLPKTFTPTQNPFYFALPYNEYDENGIIKSDFNQSTPCKNRWIKIIKDGKTAYGQWEDVGPFGEDDSEYVFGDKDPKNEINNHAGLDLSPALRDYLKLDGLSKVDWSFIDEKDVPDGPWKDIITTSNINWVDWYKPISDTSWQWQLKDELNTSYDVDLYDIDLFDTNSSTIKKLKDEGKKVICYFSAGSYEDWREDKDDFNLNALGNKLDDWEGEKWLDITDESVKLVMLNRLDLAKEKGCDGVEPDNVDGYQNDTGFNLSFEDQINYNKFLAKEARKRELSIGLKNDLDQIKELEVFFDFALNEQCFKNDECQKLTPFIQANKPVFNAEYAQEYVTNQNGARDKMCQQSKELGFQTLILPLELDGSFRIKCE